MKISDIIDDRERLRELYEERRGRVKVLEDKVKLLEDKFNLLEGEKNEYKDVLNGIIETIHKHIEIEI